MHRMMIALAVLLCGAIGFAADWPQWLGPNRNGSSPEKGLLTTWPKDGPKLLEGAGRRRLFHRCGRRQSRLHARAARQGRTRHLPRRQRRQRAVEDAHRHGIQE